MISKNVVLIETIDSMGTGFLYPCKFDGKKNVQYFIVFTNAHVLQTIGIDNINGKKDYRNQIKLLFYDDLGNKIEEDDIEELRVYNSGYCMDLKNDIAALLVAIRETVPLHVEVKVCPYILENRAVIYMEGYPGVMLDDEVSPKIQLQGAEKRIFPENREIGIYQITDEYHWYNDFHDRQLLQGLSGSPVYVEQNGKTMFLGITQSVADIHQGENPFKLMYYIKMEYILKHLREADCIIFSKHDEYIYQLEWIYGELKSKHNSEKSITLMLLGGSGAGKSSFAKDFAYHGNQLRSTNDGQTTRTKVIYEYSIVAEKCCATVNILSQKNFVANMIEKIGKKPFQLILKQALGLEAENVKSENVFLENCYKILEKIYDQNQGRTKSHKLLGNIRAVIQGKLESKEKIKCYEEIIVVLINAFPVWSVKYIIDSSLVTKIRQNCAKQYKQENLIAEIEDWIKKYDNMFTFCESEQKQEIVKAIHQFCLSENDNMDDIFSKFQETMFNIIYLKDKDENMLTDIYFCMKNNFKERLSNKDFLRNFKEALLNCEGFFYLKEFKELLPENYVENMEIPLIVTDRQISDNESDGENRKKDANIAIKLEAVIEAVYINVHRDIKEGMKQRYGSDIKFEFNLKEMNEEKRKLLQQCLQVTKEGSLTGVINYVKIEDMISDEYAMILKSLGIHKLKMVDTCGLDHIEISSKRTLKKNLLDNLYYYEKHIKISFEDISILFLKKLDSGKPDELRTILPCVREAIPTAPLYCVFSGIDIFYRSPEEISSICWKKEDEKLPKAVNYILSEKGRNEFRISEDKESTYDENMYLVLKNNIIPYCGKKGLVREKFQYYKNNTKYIRKLLASIVMKEYSSLEIIDVTELEQLNRDLKRINNNDVINSEQKNTVSDNPIVKQTEELIKYLFAYASLTSCSFRYNTKDADINSYKKRHTAGYSGTYRHQLNQLFHEAYSKVILKEGDGLASLFRQSEAAAKAALKNMERKYLGPGENLEEVDLRSEEKNKFREILELMYKTGEYQYNPFEKKIDDELLEKYRDRIFDDIFNFRKGLNNPEILNNFVIEFLICLEKQMKEDNYIKSANMLKLNQEFVDMLEALKHEYIEKYASLENEEEKKKAEDKFKDIMRHYFNKETKA